MNITIKNLSKEKPKEEWQVKVCRPSPLGNPYFMKKETERNIVCEQYEQWFNRLVNAEEILEDDKEVAFYNELNRLKIIYKKHGKLELFCWCAPKRCHSETIRKYLENEFN